LIDRWKKVVEELAPRLPYPFLRMALWWCREVEVERVRGDMVKEVKLVGDNRREVNDDDGLSAAGVV
jgi:hypothetical protein